MKVTFLRDTPPGYHRAEVEMGSKVVVAFWYTDAPGDPPRWEDSGRPVSRDVREAIEAAYALERYGRARKEQANALRFRGEVIAATRRKPVVKDLETR